MTPGQENQVLSGPVPRSYPVVGEMSVFHNRLGCFSCFDTPTIHGLARVRADRLDILAVISLTPGRGDFGRFLAECMEKYSTVAVWEIWNGSLADMLRRRGFRDVREVIVDDDLAEGMRWDKATPEASYE